MDIGKSALGSLAIFSNEAVEDLSMKSTMIALVLAGATIVALNT
jgi:hypothetical protein